MNDIEKLWKEINAQAEAEPASTAPPVFLPTAQNMFDAMVRKVRTKLRIIYAFSLIYGGWMLENILHGKSREVTYLLLVMFLFGLLNLALVLPSFNRMKKQSATMSGTFRETLQFYHLQLTTIIRQENRLAAAFTPSAALMGFFYGFIQAKGSISFIFESHLRILFLILFCLLMGVLGTWLTRWLNRVGFGKYLGYLEENLRNLD